MKQRFAICCLAWLLLIAPLWAATKVDFNPCQSGLSVYVQLYSAGQVFRPASSAFVAPSSITGAQWTAAATALTEETTSNALKTGNYPLDFATVTGLPTGKLITVYYYSGAPTPGDPPIGVFSGYWDGSNVIVQTGDSYARIGSAGAGLTAIGDTRMANLDAQVSTRFPTASAPSNFSSLAINGSGLVKLDLTQSIPTSNTAQSVGDALNAARAQGFGKWALSGTTLRLYAPDGTTVVRTFTLDNAGAPTSRQ